MAGLAKTLTYPGLPDVAATAARRDVVVQCFGRYLLPLEVRAEWAPIIASVLGAGPETSAHFYFEGCSWRLQRICESDGLGGERPFPQATLVAVVAAMRSAGKYVDVERVRPTQS